MQEFYSNGKLLLTGEYLVLDGAQALALPTTYGQSLIIEPIDIPKLYWKSLDCNGEIWYEGIFPLTRDTILKYAQYDDVSKRIIQILEAANQLNPKFLKVEGGYKVTTQLDFPEDWGLGSSSTLINNIADWAKVDAFKLLELTFGGSGYDIACAQVDQPLIYELHQKGRTIQPINFDPLFKDHLYFVHLNKKQDSRDAITLYNYNKGNTTHLISELNVITKDIIACESFSEFCSLINKHEALISNSLKQNTIKDIQFEDFEGCIKSLGAWGGDFILAGARTDPKPYFAQNGYHTIIDFNTMILQ